MATKNEIILSVKTDMLLDQAWQLIEKDGDNIDDVMEIYGKLRKCWIDIKKCTSESEYMRIWTEVTDCEKSILKYAG